MREWAGGRCVQKLRAVRLALKPESASGDRVILVIGGLALPAGKAWTTPRFPRSRISPLPSNMGSLKSGLSSAKIWVTKTVSSEILPVPLFVIARAVGLRPTSTAPTTVPRGGVDDGHGARGMVSHIEQRAVRRQGAAPRLGEPLDRRHDPALHEVNDRDGAADAIGDIRFLVVRVDSYAARLFANADFGNLGGDIVALHIFDSDD